MTLLDRRFESVSHSIPPRRSTTPAQRSRQQLVWLCGWLKDAYARVTLDRPYLLYRGVLLMTRMHRLPLSEEAMRGSGWRSNRRGKRPAWGVRQRGAIRNEGIIVAERHEGGSREDAARWSHWVGLAVGGAIIHARSQTIATSSRSSDQMKPKVKKVIIPPSWSSATDEKRTSRGLFSDLQG